MKKNDPPKDTVIATGTSDIPPVELLKLIGKPSTQDFLNSPITDHPDLTLGQMVGHKIKRNDVVLKYAAILKQGCKDPSYLPANDLFIMLRELPKPDVLLTVENDALSVHCSDVPMMGRVVMVDSQTSFPASELAVGRVHGTANLWLEQFSKDNFDYKGFCETFIYNNS
jgi:hypothetical protein